MIRQSKFQQIISSAIAKLRLSLNPLELAAFEAQINALPKKIKELNAEPYLFIFDSMLHRKDLIEHALAALTSMLQQNYLSHQLYERLAQSIAPLVKDYSYSIIKLIHQIKQPNLALIQLYFDIHSEIALPEDVLKKFKTHGYNWMIRVFRMTERLIPNFQVGIYSKFYPQEMPKLAKKEEEATEIQNYVSLVLNDTIWKVQQQLGQMTEQKGKYDFCFLCRKPADYYCKDTKVPVCSVNCKKNHLQILSRCSSLHFNYSDEFKHNLEQLLIDNISVSRSPALCIDFLVAIYLFSDYQPQATIQHSKVMAVPVIFQRIWMLYLSYYGKLNQSCEHIFASCLTQDSQFLKQMASQYFLVLAQDPRILHVYNTFDRNNDFRLLTYVLHTIDIEKSSELVKALIHTAYESFTPSSYVVTDRERPLIRAFNHEKELTPQVLKEMLGEDYEREVVKLVLRNQTEINRQKFSTLISKNQGVCRRFLQKVVERKQGAPVDEMLRQIFYFVNVKVSDKIYRLFEILSEVYIPQEPFNELNFFTYAYFVVMIVTEINNSSLSEKPNLASVISRVQKFSPELARNHPHLLRDMLARVTGSPFRQNSRGVLSHYKKVDLLMWEDMKPEEMVITNWQILYECALGESIGLAGLYHICTMVSLDPAICQSFLRLLVQQLVSPNRDPFLLQAISNTIQSQPNAAGYLWKHILQQAFSQPMTAQNDKLQISLIIHVTKRLTSDNFYQFTREFCNQVTIPQEPALFLQLIETNLGRIGMISQLLLSNYEKGKNYYQKLSAIKQIGKLLMYTANEQLAVILLQMIKQIPILPITEALVLEALLQINFDLLPNPQQFWTVISQKCLEMKEQTRVSLLQNVMRAAEYCQSYQSYLIQKTLNCHKKQLISEQILHNLSKLEPYLSDISEDVLSLFILEENLWTILSNFEHFCTFNSVYNLMYQTIQKDGRWLEITQSSKIIAVISARLDTEWKKMLALDKLPYFLISLIKVQPSTATLSTVLKYVAHLQDGEGSDLRQILMNIVNVSIVSEQFAKMVQENLKGVFENLSNLEGQYNQDELFQWFDQFLWKLLQLAEHFQQNINLRIQLKQFLQSKKSHLPSLLNTSILLSQSISRLHNYREEPSSYGFNRLLRSVEIVLDRQAEAQRQLRESTRKQGLEKMILAQANRDALKFGQMLVQEALRYLKASGQLKADQKGSLRRVLLELLVQGFFDESTCSFRALTGTKLASDVNQIFLLLK